MAPLTQDEKRALEIIGRLPPARRRAILYELARDAEAAWKRNTAFAEEQLRRIAFERGRDWDQMNDDQRQDFVSELLAEGD